MLVAAEELMDSNQDALHIRRLAHSLTLALGVGASSAHATSYVTSCLDDGSPGTLRAVLAGAPAGEQIDLLTQSACSTITLTQGEIPVQRDAALFGANGLPHVVAAPGSRVFHQTVSGVGYD